MSAPSGKSKSAQNCPPHPVDDDFSSESEDECVEICLPDGCGSSAGPDSQDPFVSKIGGTPASFVLNSSLIIGI